MKAQVKALLIVALLSLTLIGVVAGLLTTQWQIQSVVSVKGIKLGVYQWMDDSTKGAVKSNHDFGTLKPSETKKSENLVIESESVGMGMTIGFSTSLASTVGSIGWFIEFWDGYNWIVYDWKGKLNNPITISGVTYYLPGSTNNPITAGQQVGFRPPSASTKTGDTGHIWMEIAIKSDALEGQYEFGVTVTGTEVA